MRDAVIDGVVAGVPVPVAVVVVTAVGVVDGVVLIDSAALGVGVFDGVCVDVAL